MTRFFAIFKFKTNKLYCQGQNLSRYVDKKITFFKIRFRLENVSKKDFDFESHVFIHSWMARKKKKRIIFHLPFHYFSINPFFVPLNLLPFFFSSLTNGITRGGFCRYNSFAFFSPISQFFLT